jgi:hypothetical protein
MEAINFESITLRQEVSHRGGRIEIDLTTLGYDGERMVAYRNYLGGGMLGRVCAKDTIRAKHKIVELSLATELDEIAEQLKQYYFSLTNPEEGWESLSFEQNQGLPISGY